MKKLLFILLSALSLTAFAQTKKVAILEVVDREDRMSYSQKMMLRANMARAVANTAGYEAYDRSDIDAIMSEHDFQRTGLVSNDQIAQLGKMTGVSLILVMEGVPAGNDNVFVSAKILNVETAKVEIMDNYTMGVNAAEMEKGCTILAERLFGVTASSSAIEKYKIERMGSNSYIYMGKYMDSKEYEYFLRNNCPKAYKQYQTGKKLIVAGWSVFAAGFAIAGGGTAMLIKGNKYNNDHGYDVEDKEYNYGLVDGGIAMIAIGPSLSAAVGIPLFSVGYSKRNKAYQVYNNTCASSSAASISFNLTAGPNGLGLALNF